MANEILDGRYKKPWPQKMETDEAGICEYANQQLQQGNRSFYANAFDGSTPVGAAKGNLPGPPGEAKSLVTEAERGLPFVNLRGGNR